MGLMQYYVSATQVASDIIQNSNRYFTIPIIYMHILYLM